MKFAALGSGSQGNGLVVEAGSSRVMVDCGFGLADTVQRLQRIDLQPRDLLGVLVTHEHDDHIGGVARFAAKFGLPVWMTSGTWRSAEKRFQNCDVRAIEAYQPFSVGDLHITPYPVPHDAREPSQFVFGDGHVRLGLLTDAGAVTRHMLDTLTGCDALLLEFNHDVDLLRQSRYPEMLKRRIAGKWGHLSNDAATEVLRGVGPEQLRLIVGMHLSEENNNPEKVRLAIKGALGKSRGEICVAGQESGTPWFSI
jgi:phosphoribosyl 1,2-cyclic phosphodiesterase